jgi:hypothetical protein
MKVSEKNSSILTAPDSTRFLAMPAELFTIPTFSSSLERLQVAVREMKHKNCLTIISPKTL